LRISTSRIRKSTDWENNFHMFMRVECVISNSDDGALSFIVKALGFILWEDWVLLPL
jgi:hypothetical protein